MLLVETVFGSRLYGTDMPDSDLDLKRVYLCDMCDLIFGKTETRQRESMSPGGTKTETEEIHIVQFAKLVRQGQSLAYSMLFTPESMVIYQTPQWADLVQNRHRLVSKNLKPYVGYARSQSLRYSLRGSRLQTLEDYAQALHQIVETDLNGRMFPPTFNQLCAQFEGREGVRLWTERLGERQIRHIEVCGKSFGETTPLKLWLEPIRVLLVEYGHRSFAAKEHKGADLKAMYHAVRICGEMCELLRTGYITYPRPEAPLLLDIRNGKLTNGEIAELIDRQMAEADRLMLSTTLRDASDTEWLDNWVLRVQADYAATEWAGRVG